MRVQRYLKKICIGTAQFGSKYGITNKIGKTKTYTSNKGKNIFLKTIETIS